MYNVLIVEDQRMPRESMERLIMQKENYQLAGSVYSAELAIIKCKQQHIDLILMDVSTVGNKDGITCTAEIKAEFPDCKIIIVTSMVEVGYLDRARRAGADSFWYKDISDESIERVIDRTMAGESLFPDKTPNVQIGQADSGEFTPAEVNVIRLICEGYDNQEIAQELKVSVNTVKTHISHVLQKTGFSNKIKLAIAVTNKTFIIPKNGEK